MVVLKLEPEEYSGFRGVVNLIMKVVMVVVVV